MNVEKTKNVYDRYEDFIINKVHPQICRDIGDCIGMNAWLQEADRQAYDDILLLEQQLDEVWISKGDFQKFKKICSDWHEALIKASNRFRESMIPPVPVAQEPVQAKLL